MKKWMEKFLFGLFLMLAVVLYIPSAVRAADTDDYIAGGMINEKYGQLTWIVDGNGKLTVEGWGDYAYYDGYWHNVIPPWASNVGLWQGISEEIKSAEIRVTGMTYASNLFSYCKNLVSVDMSGFDTSQVTDMSYMFAGCPSLASLDLSSFDTSQVTNMSYMFGGDYRTLYGCSSLTSLDLSGFDTSQVTGMRGMFSECSSLANLDLSNFDTSQVRYMDEMFSQCSSLASLDLRSFDTSQVTSMGSMFLCCSNLASLDLSGFDTSQVTYMRYMFKGCNALKTIDLTSFVTDNVDMGEMFSGCSALTYLDLSGFVGAGWDMLADCSSLSMLYTPKSVSDEVPLPAIFYMPNGQATTVLPTKLDYSILLTRNRPIWVSDEEMTEAVTIPFKNQSMNIIWDDSLFKENAFSYNNNLAVAGLALSAAAEESEGNISYILNRMGFQKKEICNYNYDNPFNVNTPACSIAAKEIMMNGSKKTLVAVTVRGTTSMFGDLFTDVLAAGDGFSSSAKYVASLVEEYRKTYCASVASEDLLFFITGHSLGGAVASKLNQELCSAYSSGNLYVYSFAPPKYSAEGNTAYKNVYEISNGYDIIPYYGGLGSTHAGVPMPEVRGFNGSSSVYLEYYRLFEGEEATLPLPMKSMSHHNVSLYMAYLMANAKSVTSDAVSDGKNTYYITVKCPVDVEIYDAEDKLLCSIIDNVYYDHDFPDKDDDYDYDDDDYDYDYYSIDRSEHVAGTYVEGTVSGDEKHLIVSCDSEIKVRLTGTDEGKMSYSVMKLGGIGEAVAEKDIKAFETVVLEKNREFYSKIAPEKNISDVALYVIDPMTGSAIREVGTNGEEKDVKPTTAPDKPEETARPQETERPDTLPSSAPDVSRPSVMPSLKPSVNITPVPNQATEQNKVTVPSVKKVKSVKVTGRKKKLHLKWKKSSGVSGYQIQISTKKNFKGAKKISISKSKNTYTVKGLKAKKKYYIRIRAYKTYKDANKKTQKVYGKWVTINKKTK